MTIIPIQLNDADIQKLDYLIKQGRYKSRNQAIKKYFEEGIAREQIDFDTIDPDFDSKKKKLFELLDDVPSLSFHLKTRKSWADQISQERDRN